MPILFCLRWALFVVGVLTALLPVGGCAHPPDTRTPMPVISYLYATRDSHPATLIVLLPGRRDRADVFDQEGMIAVLKRNGVAADLLAADAHIGYYRRGSFARQLHTEIIEPARRRYRHIVLVGVSLGAYGAARYAMIYPDEVSTLVLLSPFLGAGPVNRDVSEAGDEGFTQTRDWLHAYPKDADAPGRRAARYPRIILGYGEQDLFPGTHAELRAHLPPDDVLTTPGAHAWGTWRVLLDRIAQRELLIPTPNPPATPSQSSPGPSPR